MIGFELSGLNSDEQPRWISSVNHTDGAALEPTRVMGLPFVDGNDISENSADGIVIVLFDCGFERVLSRDKPLEWLR